MYLISFVLGRWVVVDIPILLQMVKRDKFDDPFTSTSIPLHFTKIHITCLILKTGRRGWSNDVEAQACCHNRPFLLEGCYTHRFSLSMYCCTYHIRAVTRLGFAYSYTHAHIRYTLPCESTRRVSRYQWQINTWLPYLPLVRWGLAIWHGGYL